MEKQRCDLGLAVWEQRLLMMHSLRKQASLHFSWCCAWKHKIDLLLQALAFQRWLTSTSFTGNVCQRDLDESHECFQRFGERNKPTKWKGTESSQKLVTMPPIGSCLRDQEFNWRLSCFMCKPLLTEKALQVTPFYFVGGKKNPLWMLVKKWDSNRENKCYL